MAEKPKENAMPNRMEELEFRLSWPTSSHRFDNYSVLSVTDRASGMVVLEAEFSAEQLSALLGGRGAKVATDLISDETFSRVGKEYQHERIDIPEEFVRYMPSRAVDGKVHPSPGMQDFARDAIAGTDWEGARWSRHNYGWALTAYKWAARG